MIVKAGFHRTTAVLAGAVIGLAGAFVSAAPAGAHAGELTATSSCTDSGWMVTWNLTTTGTHGADGVFSDVKVSITDYIPPPGFPGTPRIPALTTYVDGGTVTGDAVVTEDQVFNPDALAVELAFTVTWDDGLSPETRELGASARRPAGCRYTVPTGTAVPPGGLPAPDVPAETTNPTGIPAPAVTGDTAGTGAGGLPVTGAAAGTIAGLAALLLAAGAVLLVASRRRKVKFTP